LEEGIRLACLAKAANHIVVRIPDEVRLHSQKILTKGIAGKSQLEPSVKKCYLQLSSPDLKNQVSDIESVLSGLKDKVKDKSLLMPANLSWDLDFLQSLPDLLRQENFKTTCVVDNSKLITLEPGDTSKRLFGLSLDIGTTTVAGSLIDLSSGKEIAVASKMNEQVIWGDDVISRINFVIDDFKNLAKLHSKIIEVVNSIIQELCQKSEIRSNEIYQAVVVGNPTMSHFLLNVSPVNIASLPFITVFDSRISVKAKDIGVNINSKANLIVLPGISGFVGADTIGVILSTGIYKKKQLSLAVDIGTNGEVVLGSTDRIMACSTAAGPAFEGARIEHGMRASLGAIESVVIENTKVKFGVIGGGEPVGICGTGVIDVLSQLLKNDIMDNTGRMNQDRFLLYKNKNRVIDITQKDIREVQLAKGAIRAGIEILKEQMKVDYDDIKEVLLAGAFGNYIRKDSAVGIGLIPEQLKNKIKFIGNAAFAGAKMALISTKMMRRAEKIADKTEYIELSNRTDFQEEFAKAMMFN
ncbi:MAG: DUF4445 domain-containing protein, partial [Candidatus Omnitrophica bacterium]|nr:DUF4445 domain-containing protein [Candidatus Omnitrophota bacterium]